MRIRTQFLIASALAAALSLAASRADAAPQILGLVASNGAPVPMRCEGTGCTVLLSSFCLQGPARRPRMARPIPPAVAASRWW